MVRNGEKKHPVTSLGNGSDFLFVQMGQTTSVMSSALSARNAKAAEHVSRETALSSESP